MMIDHQHHIVITYIAIHLIPASSPRLLPHTMLGTPQGYIGDCYLLSALAILCRKPEYMKKLFVTDAYSQQGLYVIQLYQGGRVKRVKIDDLMPVKRGKPAFGRCKVRVCMYICV